MRKNFWREKARQKAAQRIVVCNLKTLQVCHNAQMEEQRQAVMAALRRRKEN